MEKVRTLTFEGQEYEVSNRRGILNPGKFEGESLHAVRDYVEPEGSFGSIDEDGFFFYESYGRFYSEDSQGFVTETTEEAYRFEEVAHQYTCALREERDQALADAQADLQAALEEETGPCDSCEVLMINRLRCHETGCPRERKLKDLKARIQAIEEA